MQTGQGPQVICSTLLRTEENMLIRIADPIITQFQVVPGADGEDGDIYALRDDGTFWIREMHRGASWKEIEAPTTPAAYQLKPFHTVEPIMPTEPRTGMFWGERLFNLVTGLHPIQYKMTGWDQLSPSQMQVWIDRAVGLIRST